MARAQNKGAEGRLPLFFKEPLLVSSNTHGDWKIREGDYSFAADAVSIPLSVGEIMTAGHDYPVLFAGAKAAPVALVGVKDANLFVENGRWASDVYIPAYVRRYPFSTVTVGEDQNVVLMVDAASDRVVKGDAEAAGNSIHHLFVDGKPSDYTKRLMAFCDQFHRDAQNTESFGVALVESGILTDRRAEMSGPDGSDRLSISGFQVVDTKRLMELPDDIVLDWHQKNWLALIHYHLASLGRFAALGRKREERRKGAFAQSDMETAA